MISFFGCGCVQRPQSELQPIVWAGRHNEWRRITEMTDEFKGNFLNERKWFPYCPFSHGHSPGLFVPSNVYVGNQAVHLTAKCNGIPRHAPEGFHKWTTSAIVSQTAMLYGYAECYFRASNTELASRFKLIGREDNKMTDIDVFTYSAAEKHKELVYMNATVARKNIEGDIDWVNHPLKKVILDMPNSPVTVGIDWTPEYIKTYVDGQVIRYLENKHWHIPMHVCFLLETVKEEFGLPKEGTFSTRNDFEVYYIRTWNRFPCQRQEPTPGLNKTYST